MTLKASINQHGLSATVSMINNTADMTVLHKLSNCPIIITIIIIISTPDRMGKTRSAMTMYQCPTSHHHHYSYEINYTTVMYENSFCRNVSNVTCLQAPAVHVLSVLPMCEIKQAKK